MLENIKIKIIINCRNLVRALRGEISTEKLIKKGLQVGENFSRQGGCWIDVSFPYMIEIGDNVGLSRNVTILAHDNSLSRLCGLLKVGGGKNWF